MNIRKNLILLFLVLAGLFGFSTTKADTTTIFVGDTITYQGQVKTKIPVYIDNIDQNITAFTLLFVIVPDNRAYFTTDHFEVNIDTVCSLQVSPCPPEKIIRIDTIMSRVVKIDKNGSLTSNFPILEAHGEVGDTSSPYCINLTVLGMAPNGQPLGPGFGLLFNLYLDMQCVPDSALPDTLVYVNVYGTLATPGPQGDTLVREKKFLPGRPFIFSMKYGDCNNDNNITISDVVYLINYLFKGGPPPNPLIKGDANGDGNVTISDGVYLVNYLFKGGSPPHCFEI